MEMGIRLTFGNPTHYYHCWFGHHEVDIYDFVDENPPFMNACIKDLRAEDEKAEPLHRRFSGPDRFDNVRSWITSAMTAAYIGKGG